VPLTQTTLQSILSGVFLLQRLLCSTFAWKNNYTIHIYYCVGNEALRIVTWFVPSPFERSPRRRRRTGSRKPWRTLLHPRRRGPPVWHRPRRYCRGWLWRAPGRAPWRLRGRRRSRNGRGTPWALAAFPVGGTWRREAGRVARVRFELCPFERERKRNKSEREREMKRSESVGCGAYKERWVEKKKKNVTQERQSSRLYSIWCQSELLGVLVERSKFCIKKETNKMN